MGIDTGLPTENCLIIGETGRVLDQELTIEFIGANHSKRRNSTSSSGSHGYPVTIYYALKLREGDEHNKYSYSFEEEEKRSLRSILSKIRYQRHENWSLPPLEAKVTWDPKTIQPYLEIERSLDRLVCGLSERCFELFLRKEEIAFYLDRSLVLLNSFDTINQYSIAKYEGLLKQRKHTIGKKIIEFGAQTQGAKKEFSTAIEAVEISFNNR